MNFKIALNNVKKSFKDYGVYFLTLTLAVCIFYTFNSIGSQNAFMELQQSQKTYIETLNNIMSYISIFVIVVLGSLIIYANKFLIKKRNKEFGIYMILGMGKFKISKILIFETFFIGIISLLSGLILGIIFSQGISLLSLNLFEIDMDRYTFVVSFPAILKTILYFSIMFILVMILNLIMISKFKIINLINSTKRNEKIKLRNPFIHLILFVLAILSLIYSYNIALKLGLMEIFNNLFLTITVISLGVIGTILFFLSISSFLIYIFKRNNRIYFRGLNIFIVKQIGSKINTNFLSMSIICLMLFMTIGILSSGAAYRNSITNGLIESTPFDASAYMYLYDEDLTVEESFERMGFEFDEGDEFVYFNEYTLDTKLSDILDKNYNYDVRYIKISDYNKIRELRNEEPLELLNDEVLMISNRDNIVPLIEEYLKNNDKIKINGMYYKIKNNKLIQENLITYAFKNNILTMVINDQILENSGVISVSNVNVNFNRSNNSESQKEFIEFLEIYKDRNLNRDEVGFVVGSTRDRVYEDSKGLTTIILFIGIYLGIIFLISSMAVLSIQQLTDINDSINRYNSLKRLGVSIKQINKTIFSQVLIYFSLPICLAIIHSIVGLKLISDILRLYNEPDIFVPSLITMGIILIVYLLYFYVTYGTYKNVVKNEI